jgi:PPOX class probable F420-dependent enzyme
MQADYGMPRGEAGLMAWADVERRLADAQNYWVVTVGRDGTPQATPVWGVWLDGRFCFSCGADTVKRRNLRRNPHVAVHLESGDQAVMLRGTAELTGGDDEPRVIAALQRKYGRAMVPDTFAALSGVGFIVRPLSILSWSSFPTDVTRWEPA